jgi:hypothetical protein
MNNEEEDQWTVLSQDHSPRISAGRWHETTIKIIFVLLTMSNWTAHVADVRGAF